MKNILKCMLAVAFMAMLSSYSNAQTKTRLCFQTGTNVQSCQNVDASNPLPTTATLSVSSLNVSPNVTVVNTIANPVITTCANCATGTVGGAVTVTVTNTVASPAIVTCTNCGATFSGGAVNVTVTNTAGTPVIVSAADIHTIATTTGPTTWGGGSLASTQGGAALVTCTNCGASSVTGPFNVTITNIADGVDVTLGAKADSAITTSGSSGSLVAFVKGLASLLSTLNTSVTSAIPAGTNLIGSVTCTNCTANSGPFNVTVTNTPAVTLAATNVTVTNTVTVAAHNVSVTNTPAVTNTLGTSGGWTPILLTNLLTTANAVKGSAGQLGKLFCYNPNSSVAYVQVFNVASGSVTAGTTTPLNSYGIPATSSAGFAFSTTGDQYGTAISVVATTTAKGGTPPTTGVDCNASYN